MGGRYAGRGYEREEDVERGGSLLVKGLKSMWRQAAPIVRNTLQGSLRRIIMQVRRTPSALCPLPYALCPMPSALSPLPFALCHNPEPSAFALSSLPSVHLPSAFLCFPLALALP